MNAKRHRFRSCRMFSCNGACSHQKGDMSCASQLSSMTCPKDSSPFLFLLPRNTQHLVRPNLLLLLEQVYKLGLVFIPLVLRSNQGTLCASASKLHCIEALHGKKHRIHHTQSSLENDVRFIQVKGMVPLLSFRSSILGLKFHTNGGPPTPRNTFPTAPQPGSRKLAAGGAL